MAGTAGIEPTMAGSKPAALPLGYVPKWGDSSDISDGGGDWRGGIIG